jgi:hypothetical protein
MPREERTESSPIIGIYQELRALQPTWHVEMGRPHGPGWITGTDLRMAGKGPFNVLLSHIGDRLHTADRRTIAAAFALRYGWSAGMAIAPCVLGDCVPTITLDNVSLKFGANTLFERVALHRPTGVMLHPGGGTPHPLIQWLLSHQDLLGWLRTSLVQQAQPIVDTLYEWSRFARKGLWGMITSSWGAQFMQICGAIDTQTSGLQYVEPFFAGNDVVAQMQPSFYPVTYHQVTHLYHRRATCCRYYLLPRGSYCASCPLLSQEERLQRNHTWMRHLVDLPTSL